MIGIFSRTLARFPVVVLVVSGCLGVTLTLIGLFATDWPDFSNPLLGFNTTDTEISNKLLALYNLQNEIGVGKAYYQFPSEIPKRSKNRTQKTPKMNRKWKNTSEPILDNKLTERFVCADGRCNRTDEQELLEPIYCPTALSNNLQIYTGWSMTFWSGCTAKCDNLAHLVFEIKNIPSYSSFRKLCDIETKLWMPSSSIRLIKRDNCLVQSLGPCCQAWHLGSVAASILGKVHCTDVNETDFEHFITMLNYCSQFKKFILTCYESDSWETCTKSNMPSNCSSQDYYFVYNFLLPKTFYNFTHNDDLTPGVEAKYTLMMLPVSKQVFENENSNPEMIKNLQRELNNNVGDVDVRLAAMDLGLRDLLFMDYLLTDTVYGVLAVVFVLVSMWIYTGSLLFTAASVFGILMSMGVAYFVYRTIVIDFFPFMNLLTFVLMVGLGADDTFIYRSAWTRAKSKKHAGTLPKIVSDTLWHAAAAMFVTSLTTAAAFFSNFLSHIIVIKCFGVFAGITVLTNYVVVITWLPAAVIIIEKYDCSLSNVCRCCSIRERYRIAQQELENSNSANQQQQQQSDDVDFVRNKMNAVICCLICYNPIVNFYHRLVDYGKVFVEKLLPWLVIKFRYVWIAGFGLLSVVAAVAVFHSPGLRLPDKDYFQYFQSRHPFERWENDFKYKFAFSSNVAQMPMLSKVIWGVGPTTDARHLNPLDRGTLNVWPNGTFQFDANLALVWLRDFCSKMSVEEFTRYEGVMLPYCFVNDFMTWMNAPCSEADGKTNRTPCCNENPFPYPPTVFDGCLKRVMTKFPNDIQRGLIFNNFRNGPFFNSTTHKFSLLTVAFPSKYNFSLSYHEMDEYYTTVNDWVNNELANGPSMVREGWFVSEHLQFYDLQKALLYGTQTSVAVAVGIAFGVLFLTTLNPLISLLAIISISSVIFATIACLILLDWELNILESTIIILTIGLSFDFTLHYAVSYKLGGEIDRETRVINTLSRTSGPVFMAMITTFLAGLSMMPSTTLAYFQIGLFMMIVTTISWLYATFFFCSLLYVVGPTGDQCQFHLSSFYQRRKKFSNDFSGRKLSAGRRISNSPGKIGGSLIVGGELSSDVVELEPMMATTTMIMNDSKDSKSASQRNQKERPNLSVRRASMPIIRRSPMLVETTNNGDTHHKILANRL